MRTRQPRGGTSARQSELTLQFDREKLIVGTDVDLRAQLSAVAADGDRLWLACDEGCRIERLTRAQSKPLFAAHRVFPLDSLLDLPASAADEADIEGLYVDEGWLWLVGSHSVKRRKPRGRSSSEVAKALLETRRDGNRHLLARIPIVDGGLRARDGSRRAAMLSARKRSSTLLDAVRADDHFAAFVDIPGKDNGFDIEGLAVRGLRAWVGLRGPVLREWCCVLEMQFKADGRELRLRKSDGGRYRKHFLQLNGLGVRDLALLDDDLLILAGPTMAHDGPCQIWRWRNAARQGAVASPDAVRLLHTLPPAANRDRPEGIAVLDDGKGPASLLVVFDAPSERRLLDPAGVRADLYAL